MEEQYPELMKIYNYMVKIIKKRCTRRYGKMPFLIYALPEGDKIYYPIHDILNNLFMRRIVLQRSERQPDF